MPTQSSLCRLRFALSRLPPTLLVYAVITMACISSPAWGASAFAGVVNLNTASQQELEQLPGVGPSKASRIMEHRERRPFRTVAELVRVKGFGAKTLQRLRPYLTVTGPTQLKSEASNAACPCSCAAEAQATKSGGAQVPGGSPKPQARGDTSM